MVLRAMALGLLWNHGVWVLMALINSLAFCPLTYLAGGTKNALCSGLGSIQFRNWNCGSIPIPIPELELELKLVELKMESELKTLELELELELKTGIEIFLQLLPQQ